MYSRRIRAFTLIELLIVVAIIAILAAIAVPNFLEAQVRAKTARVKSDMRTVDTAMKAYFVEYNEVPYDGNDSPTWRYAGMTFGQENPGKTPEIRFMGGGLEQYYCFSYFVPLTTPVAYLTSVPKDGFTKYMPYGYNTRARLNGTPFVGYNIIFSAGPDRIGGDWYPGLDPQQPMGIPYDPSNGTKSQGDIWRALVIKDLNWFKAEYPFEYD